MTVNTIENAPYSREEFGHIVFEQWLTSVFYCREAWVNL